MPILIENLFIVLLEMLVVSAIVLNEDFSFADGFKGGPSFFIAIFVDALE